MTETTREGPAPLRRRLCDQDGPLPRRQQLPGRRRYRATYRVALEGQQALCTCPARAGCSHIAAARLHHAARYPEEDPMTYDPTDPERPFTDPTEPGPAPVQSAPQAPEEPLEPEPEEPDALPVTVDADTGEILEPRVPDTTRAEADLADVPFTWRAARTIADTEFVPPELRARPGAVAAAVWYGREVGVPPMQALAHIDIVDGRPNPDAETLGRADTPSRPLDPGSRDERRARMLRGTRSTPKTAWK